MAAHRRTVPCRGCGLGPERCHRHIGGPGRTYGQPSPVAVRPETRPDPGVLHRVPEHERTRGNGLLADGPPGQSAANPGLPHGNPVAPGALLRVLYARPRLPTG